MVKNLTKYFVIIYAVMHFLVSPIMYFSLGSTLAYTFLHQFFGPFYTDGFGLNLGYMGFAWWIVDLLYLLLGYFSVVLSILIFIKWNEPESTEVLQTPPGIFN